MHSPQQNNILIIIYIIFCLNIFVLDRKNVKFRSFEFQRVICFMEVSPSVCIELFILVPQIFEKKTTRLELQQQQQQPRKCYWPHLFPYHEPLASNEQISFSNDYFCFHLQIDALNLYTFQSNKSVWCQFVSFLVFGEKFVVLIFIHFPIAFIFKANDMTTW